MRHRYYVRFFAIILLLVVIEPQLAAQERAKIGLALSGGGARGFAHIGVLEWFEEHRIPVDYIAGTSMGGLVGGLYATGMSPAEMRRLLATRDWDRLLSGPPTYDELSFRGKEDRRAYPTPLEFGLRHGLRLPRGINAGHYIGLTIDRLTLPHSALKSFDDLPIPFRCVATDMIAAKPVILKDGSLSQALRATMAIPGVFTPTEIGGRVLADGGLLNNVPSDVVKDMGADVIIAVNVGTPLGDRETMETLPGILVQVIAIATIEGERQGLMLANIVIAPDLGDYTRFAFREAGAIADLGYKGTDLKAAELDRLALSDAAWRQHLAARAGRKKTVVAMPIRLDITGVDEEQAADIREQLTDDIRQPVEPEKLERQLSEIRGAGRYESLGYEIAQGADGPRLRIRVAERTYGPPFLIPVVQVQSQASTDFTFSTGFRLTHYDLGGRGAELRGDAIIGTNDLVGIEYYRPFANGRPFVAPRAFRTSDRSDLYQNENRVSEYLVHRGGGALDIGYNFGRRAQLRAGYQFSKLDARVDVGTPELPNVEGNISAAAMRFVYDGQNHAVAPTRGMRISSDMFWYFTSPGAPRAFPRAEAGLSVFQSVSEKGTLFAYGSGGTSFKKMPGPAQQFTLGGPLRLSAYGSDEFRGRHYLLGSAGYRHHLGSLPTLLGGRMFAGAWYETGSAFFSRGAARYVHDVAGALLLETLLGPLTVGAAWGQGGRGKVFFSFGRLFWGQHVTGSELDATYP
jgi:NTE family protein